MGTGIIVDADVIIRGEKGSFEFREWCASRTDDVFAVAAITVAELWHGVDYEVATFNSRHFEAVPGLKIMRPVV